jgi:formylglycine-generating enzyme required for sulfatase activity
LSDEPEFLVHPVPWRPRARRLGEASRPRRRRLPRRVFALALLLRPSAGFLLAARAVEVAVEPPPDRLHVRGGLPLRFGDVRLLLPGSYTVVAEKAGFRPLEAPLVVTADPRQTARYVLARLPGRLVLQATPDRDVRVFVDGDLRGTTPLDALEVAEGDHEVTLRAEGYAPFTARINVAGGGETQTLEAVLRADRARVSFSSEPPGAGVRVDGAPVGVTPVAADLTSGERRIEVSLEGFRAESRTIRVTAEQPLAVPMFRLVALPGRLRITSEPPGATVSVEGRFRGDTPLELEVPAGSPQTVRAAKAGHTAAEATVTLARGETRPLAFALEAETGEVRVDAEPADALVFVDGEARGKVGQTLRLPATPHVIEIRRAGHETHRVTLTPRPSVPQSVRARLRGEKAAEAAARPEVVRSPAGHELRLLRGGRFQMGASRREPGRRANETLREVELERPFYLATREVTNAQFRRFKADHVSGRFGAHELGGDDHPVVNVTWEAAAEYCNWLGAQEGLPAVYAVRDGKLEAALPLGLGYRLPTEAEWSRAARYAPDGPRRFPWGPALPAPPRSGNFADESARALVPMVLQAYEDRFPATAPVGSFPPNGLGFFDLAGNVAEWVHDAYSIPPPDAPLERDPTGPAGPVSELRLSYRDYGAKARPDVGFRVARYAE